MGSDCKHTVSLTGFFPFLSTLPAWGATFFPAFLICPPPDFYPRSPRGERPLAVTTVDGPSKDFYPRSPRGERRARKARPKLPKHFYPRSPRGERPYRLLSTSETRHFYPRSPRGERRSPTFQHFRDLTNFYPRSPRGERLLGNVVVGLHT